MARAQIGIYNVLVEADGVRVVTFSCQIVFAADTETVLTTNGSRCSLKPKFHYADFPRD